MAIEFDDRPSESPYIERVWRSRSDAVVRDPMVSDVLDGGSPDVAARTVRRHFSRVTGLTPGAVRQIERARTAAALIRTGAPIADVAHDLGSAAQGLE